ncbi:helix-turn-helix transcriptional regulator [Streptomyces sp. M19]
MTATDVLDLLSTREIEVLGHLAEGHTYTSIARRMHLSPHTVDTYLRRIRGKAGSATGRTSSSSPSRSRVAMTRA